MEVTFPAGLYAHNAQVTDFLPPNATYVSSGQVTGGDPVTIASTTDAGTSPDSVTFSLGDAVQGEPGLYVSPGQTFLVDLALTEPTLETVFIQLTGRALRD